MEYTFDVSGWKLDKWTNDKQVYKKCGSCLKGLPIKIPGVYYIYKGDELMYIGCTVNFRGRLTEHLMVNTNTKVWINDATTIICDVIEDKDIRAATEYFCIESMKPTMNKELPRLTADQIKILEVMKCETEPTELTPKSNKE